MKITNPTIVNHLIAESTVNYANPENNHYYCEKCKKIPYIINIENVEEYENDENLSKLENLKKASQYVIKLDNCDCECVEKIKKEWAEFIE
jgi:hypothetical protein